MVFLQGKQQADTCCMMRRKANVAGALQGFDKLAPLGPALISSKVGLKVKVNDEPRQDTPISDLVFNVSNH